MNEEKTCGKYQEVQKSLERFREDFLQDFQFLQNIPHLTYAERRGIERFLAQKYYQLLLVILTEIEPGLPF